MKKTNITRLHYNAAPYTLIHVVILAASYIIQRILMDRQDRHRAGSGTVYGGAGAQDSDGLIEGICMGELFENDLTYDMTAYIHLQKAVLHAASRSLQDFPYPWQKPCLKARLEESGACSDYLQLWIEHIKACKVLYYDDTLPRRMSFLLFLIDACLSLEYWRDNSGSAFLAFGTQTAVRELKQLIRESFSEQITPEMVLKNLHEDGFRADGPYHKAAVCLFDTILKPSDP